MRKALLALVASLTLSVGCVGPPLPTPNPRIPHRISRDATVRIWVEADNGKFVEVKVKVTAGWWVASPLVVEEK